MLSYSDYIKSKKEVLIDCSNLDNKVEDISNIDKYHPNLTKLELYHTNINDIDVIKNLKNLDILIIGNDDSIKEIHIPKTVKNVNLNNCKNLEKITCDEDVYFDELYINTTNISDFSFIKNCKKLYIGENANKDLSSFKNSDVELFNLSLNRYTSLETLYGFQYFNDSKVSIFGSHKNHDFSYHQMFVQSSQYKGNIKDYWKDIVDYWLISVSSSHKDFNAGLTELLKLNQFDEVINQGIKLPKSEYKRIFGDQYKNLFKSLKGANKFNL